MGVVIFNDCLMLVCFQYRVPGRLNDRRTPLGELNWIFTAITDTIAWNTIPQGMKLLFFKACHSDHFVSNRLISEIVSSRPACSKSLPKFFIS